MLRAGLVQRLRYHLAGVKVLFVSRLAGPQRAPAVFICKLRKKLAQAGADNVIGTVWGRGYMLRDPASAHPAAAKAQTAAAPMLARAA
jgi:two-component system cell cycle response regulator CtrA